MLMRHSLPHAPIKHNRSLQKFVCPHVDKTFPDLVQKIRKDDSTSPATRETNMVMTMRQYEKKFYTDEIKLLLMRIQAMNDKCTKQELELTKLKSKPKLEKVSHIMHTNETQAFENFELQDDGKEDTNNYLTVRLKEHYEAQIEKIKSGYQKKLKEKDKQKANACKALQFQHHCELMQIKFAEQKLRKQKEECQNQRASLKKKLQEIEQNIQSAGQNYGVEIQSYKQENALLRSFIYKVQMVEKQLSKLEQSRKKQRKQFVEFAEESEQEKRELLKQLQAAKSGAQEKIQLVTREFEQKLASKELVLNQLLQKIEEIQLNRKKESQKQLSLKSSWINWQKIQPSPRKTSSKKLLNQKILSQTDGPTNLQGNYYREMQRLRIQRNHIALQNNKMAQKINVLQQELGILKIRFQSQQQRSQSLKSKLSQLNILQVESQIKQEHSQIESKVEHLQHKEIIGELQQALKMSEEKNKHMDQQYAVLHNYYRNKENSMKLTLQMSENSYKQLWDKHCLLLTSLKNQREQKQSLAKQIDELTLKQSSSQHLALKQQRQKQLLGIQCQTLREKYDVIKQQFNQVIKQSHEKLEQDEIVLFRQKKQLERYERDVQSLNYRIRTDFEQFEKQKSRKNQEIQKMQRVFNMKEQASQKHIHELEQKINSTKKQFQKILEQKQKEIQKLTPINNTVKTYKPIATLFNQQGEQVSKSTITHYQQQICQINANHQNEIDHLKQYIHELVVENDQLRQNYAQAAKTWREMYEGVIRYNKFVDQGQIKLESSTARKRQIVDELDHKGEFKMGIMESVKMVDQEQIVVKHTNMTKYDQFYCPPIRNSSQVFTVPDFSERKLSELDTSRKLKSAVDQGQADVSTKNLTKEIQNQSWRENRQSTLRQILEEQQNSDNSNKALIKKSKYK